MLHATESDDMHFGSLHSRQGSERTPWRGSRMRFLGLHLLCGNMLEYGMRLHLLGDFQIFIRHFDGPSVNLTINIRPPTI
jgi:hypothetical protein